MDERPLEPTAPEYFGRRVLEYDSLIRRAVPRYDEMTERLLGYLPESAGRVLELGCGTGNLTAELARRYPAAEIVSVDAAGEMIATTRARLEREVPGAAKRCRFIHAAFESLALDPAEFDVATSCISLHHVVSKGPVYERIAAALVPGGVLGFADQLGAPDGIHSLNWARWLEFCRAPGHCTPDELASLVDHANAHDHYTPLTEHFRLLADAGFGELDCVWRNWIWGIIAARKTG